MGKIISLISAGLFFITLSAFLTVNDVYAFCVYNETDTLIGAEQIHLFQGMSKDKIPPGDKACCHWSNKDCNPDGKKDSKVTLRVGWKTAAGPFICEKEIKAGGHLTVSGKEKHGEWNLKCDASYEE